uniref:Fibrillar collagen NC1 domain-containing protein n=1 Tax=Heterorhabditis bacteriophora TaxID=37862 RepID=A0A1I7WU47_HETBA
MELKRSVFLVEMLTATQQVLVDLIRNNKFSQLHSQLESLLKASDETVIEEDLMLWSNQNGKDAPTDWPAFELVMFSVIFSNFSAVTDSPPLSTITPDSAKYGEFDEYHTKSIATVLYDYNPVENDEIPLSKVYIQNSKQSLHNLMTKEVGLFPASYVQVM